MFVVHLTPMLIVIMLIIRSRLDKCHYSWLQACNNCSFYFAISFIPHNLWASMNRLISESNYLINCWWMLLVMTTNEYKKINTLFCKSDKSYYNIKWILSMVYVSDGFTFFNHFYFFQKLESTTLGTQERGFFFLLKTRKLIYLGIGKYLLLKIIHWRQQRINHMIVLSLCKMVVWRTSCFCINVSFLHTVCLTNLYYMI